MKIGILLSLLSISVLYCSDKGTYEELTRESLMPHSVKKKYKHFSQEQKDELLMALCNRYAEQEVSYIKWRKGVAKGIFVGGSVKVAQQDPDGVYHIVQLAVSKQDIGLTKILLEHGADVQEKDDDDVTPIFYAKGCDIAELCMQYGALKEPKLIQTLLHTVAYGQKHEPALITLYRKNGVLVNTLDKYDRTCFMRLAQSVYRQRAKTLLKKAELLSEGLKQEEINHVIFTSSSKGSVFDMLRIKSRDSGRVRYRKKMLRNFLIKTTRLDATECAICLDLLSTRPLTVTECHHVFCTKCLAQWSSKWGNGCPQCRTDINDNTN